MWNRIFIGFVLFFVVSGLTCTRAIEFVPDNELSVAFYNLDNLFDDVDDTTHNDTEFTPGGKYKWTPERYRHKLDNMEKVIRQMVDGEAPDVMGVCELESKKAFFDLLSTGLLKGNYGIVHYDSPDERGIDVALAYNKEKISVLESRNVMVSLSDNPRDRTRDILWVKVLSKKSNDTFQFIVCHFPSRREGKEKTEQDRLDAAKACKKIVREKCRSSVQNLIVMGDFNDEPFNKSVLSICNASDGNDKKSGILQNLMWPLLAEKKGTYLYRNKWEMLDQFIISKALSDGTKPDYEVFSTHIMDEPWMIQTGKYKGYPLRTFGGNEWLNGYSDHFPVYLKIKLTD